MWMHHMDTYVYTSTTVVGCGGVNAPPLRVLKGTNKELQLPNLLYLAGCTSRTRHSKTECHLIGVLRTPYHHICSALWCGVWLCCMLYCCDVSYSRSSASLTFLIRLSIILFITGTYWINSFTYVHTHIRTRNNIVDTLLT